jgi:hypothetical protein
MCSLQEVYFTEVDWSYISDTNLTENKLIYVHSHFYTERTDNGRVESLTT